jgi:hypothetical protein
MFSCRGNHHNKGSEQMTAVKRENIQVSRESSTGKYISTRRFDSVETAVAYAKERTANGEVCHIVRVENGKPTLIDN